MIDCKAVEGGGRSRGEGDWDIPVEFTQWVLFQKVATLEQCQNISYIDYQIYTTFKLKKLAKGRLDQCLQ